MTEISKRVGLVLLAAMVGSIGGTIFAILFGFVKALIGSGGSVSLGGALVVGIGWFGAISALVGALIGKEAAEEGGKQPTRTADAVAWIVAVIVALLCLSVLYAR
jgi:hypothetical protein